MPSFVYFMLIRQMPYRAGRGCYIHKMKALLTIILVIASWTVRGQDISLLGKYKQAFFMYDFSLTLKDSSQFVIQEDTDLGSKTTMGTWTCSNDILKLKPTRVLFAGRPKMEKKEIPVYINEILVSVDNQKRLKVIAPQGTDMTAKDQLLEKVK